MFVTHQIYILQLSGTLKTCCDYEATKDIFIYDKNFPELYFSEKFKKSFIQLQKFVVDVCMAVTLK